MIYTFWCPDCEQHFEVKESLAQHESHKEECPKCGSKKVERRMEDSIQVQTSRKS